MDKMISIKFQTLAVQKDGNTVDEYQDASTTNTIKYDGALEIYAAVADGATDSYFAGIWARMLTRAFSKGAIETIDDLQRQLGCLSERWHNVVTRKPLNWYDEEGVEKGAFATLCGVKISLHGDNANSGVFKATAIGDSCLIQVRKEKLINMFPINCSSEFGNNPWLISSNLKSNQRLLDHYKLCQGDWQSGDCFIIMTDAIAQWFLHEFENELRPWDVLFQLSIAVNCHQAFIDWVSEMLNSKNKKNDDTTVIIIKMGC
jgi:hypothetical protein